MTAGPEAFDLLAGRVDGTPPEFVLRRSKVERPSLPDETLRRDRLLQWLDAKIHRRVIFVVAEAGFGKTTLLADFARRTRLRTIWYRLDEDDTDAISFLRYLVAACQQADPSLVPRTAALLSEPPVGPSGWEPILETFLGELAPLSDAPTILILDDYHLGEKAESIRQVVERLLARAPERITFVFATRRTPLLAVARLRGRDELAELGRDELRFDSGETERLFRETYRQALEPDMLRELQKRTEGWAASLQLVKAAVSGRSAGEVRAFIRALSGAEGKLYDYLAEEVIGELEPSLLAFVMRVALLDEVEPEVAATAARISAAEARSLLTQAERLGLVTRPTTPAAFGRLHPLVREFLVSRLQSEIGLAHIADLHREIARFLESRSWRASARHWSAAGEAGEVRRVVAAATPTIVGTGDYAAANDFITQYPDPNPNPWFDIITTRLLASRGDLRAALEVAQRGLAAAARIPHSEISADAALNVAFAATRLGDATLAINAIEIGLAGGPVGEIASILGALRSLIDASSDGSLDECRRKTLEVREIASNLRHTRHEGISLANLAFVDRIRDSCTTAAEYGEAAIELLNEAGAPDEVAAAHLNTAYALAHLGRWSDALVHLKEAELNLVGCGNVVDTTEIAEIHCMYGDLDDAESAFRRSPAPATAGEVASRQLCEARIALQRGDLGRVNVILDSLDSCPPCVGFNRAADVVRLQAHALAGNATTADEAAALQVACDEQQAYFWSNTAEVVGAAVGSPAAFSRFLASMPAEHSAFLSINAEVVSGRIGELTEVATGVVTDEATARPVRWRRAARKRLESSSSGRERIAAARLLEAVGDNTDILPLRQMAMAAREPQLRDLGRALIRRLAPRAYVEDLGKVMLSIGGRDVPGTEIRRRVLGLLCFLLTRPQFAATREQVLDAIWPDQDPGTATNSLNQTAYFLRRVFEPDYSEATTAGYLRHESDLIWLDTELVQSRSNESHQLIDEATRQIEPVGVLQASEAYTAQFALDFAYEDWAQGYRESLHAAYLQMVERAVARDTEDGEYGRAIVVAQRAMTVDPDAEPIEASLLHLYRLTGAHSAAAEQYGHYADTVREQLGVEPPALESL